MTRYLGIDHGTKRIGLAVGDSETHLASPLRIIKTAVGEGALMSELIAVISDYNIDELVVGLPLNMDDTESEQSKVARSFGLKLEQAAGKKVHFADERLTSFEAAQRLTELDPPRAKFKERRDALAAQVILQEFLNSNPDSPG